MVISSIKNEFKKSEDDEKSLVYGNKLSSVGPGNISGNNMAYVPSNIDLAMKLHYIKLVYFLDKKTVEGLTLRKIKECMFTWFNYYYESCGRFRRSDNGRPYIKCNDCGMRFSEAKSSKMVGEWLEMEEEGGAAAALSLLVPQDHVIGPDLTFSPPGFLQTTFFKCGGISLGLSWAHVLGDAFSVSNFMKTLAQLFSGQKPNQPPYIKKSPPNFEKPMKAVSSGPFCIKDVGPLGDHWIKPMANEMGTFTFQVTHTQLAQLQSKLFGNDKASSSFQPFEMICAVIWLAIAKVRVGLKPNVVTVIKKDDIGPIEDELALRNNQIVSSVKADLPVDEAQLKDLAILIRDWAQDERAQIGEMVDRDPEGSDFVIYGSNLTFVNLGEADFYGFEVNGLGPRFVNCCIDGIGEQGVVLVIPAPKHGYANVDSVESGIEGRVVTLMLPKTEMVEFKKELMKELDIIC